MSVLRVYLNWVNSVLSDTGRQVEGLADVQKGEVLCQLLNILSPGADLHYTVTAGGEVEGQGTILRYLDQVISYLTKHGVKLSLTSQDVIQGDVKSILDLLWAIILHFTVHNPKRSVDKRTIRNGKKLILKWCCKQLPSGVWNPQKTVTNNLCSHENFSKLLQQVCGSPVKSTTEDKEEQILSLLSQVESKYKVKGEIIKPKELLDGTIEDHDLLIYIALLRWRIGETQDSESSSEENSTRTSDALQDNSSFHPSDLGRRIYPMSTEDNQSGVPLSVMLKSYTNGQDNNHSYMNKMSDKKFVTFSGENDSLLEKGKNCSAGSLRLSRPNSAPTSRFSGSESNTSGKSGAGRFVRSFSPSRYAKSFEIPADKKKELENRSVKINGQVSGVITPPLGGHTSDTNGFSEDTSDWLSSDMEYQGNTDKGIVRDTINLKVKEVVTGCEAKSLESEKSRDNPTCSDSHCNQTRLPSTNNPGIKGYQNGEPKNNFRIPVGGVPLFGMTPGAPMSSGVSGGVPLFLLPGHGPEVARLLEVLQQQQHTRQTLADMTDGAVSLGDTSQFETSERISEGDYTEYSNIGDETSSSSDSRGKLEKNHSQDSSEAELKHLGGSRTPSEDLAHYMSRESRLTDPQRLTDSGCESQSRPESNQGCKIQEDESLKKIRLLRESLQKPMEDDKLNDRSFGSGDLHMDDLSSGRRGNVSPGMSSLETKPLAPKCKPEQHFTRRLIEDVDEYRSKNNTSGDGYRERAERFPKGEKQFDKDLVHLLTDEIRNLKSKVLTLERSQEGTGPDSLEQQERGRNTERSRLPKGPSKRSSRESPPRSLLRSPERTSLSSIEASRRARDTVSDLLVTMQSPLSRKTAEDDIDQRSRRDLSRRPLLSYHGFGRSLSEDRLHRNQCRRRENHSPVDDWRSRSFHGHSEQSQDPDYYREARSRSLQDLSGRKIPTGILMDDELIVKPPSAAPIKYGYSSPIQKVSSDIWGVDIKDLDSLEPGRQEKWKRLTEPKKFMTDSQIIELKQCLASATMENEILHAKVGNASHEIGEKMTKMAQVLEETKLSLIKTQAENEELHTQLNRERLRSDTLEVRVADLEGSLTKSRSDCERLEQELEEARTLLGGTDADGIHKVEQENYQLKRQLNVSKQEQKKTKEELESMKVSRDRAHSAVKDLQVKLDDTREENHFLSQEINEVKTQERSYRKTATLLTRAADIKERFSNRDEKMSAITTEDRLQADRIHSFSPATPAHTYTTSTPYSKLKSSEPLMTSSPSRGHFIPRSVSPTDISPVKNYPSRPKSYNYEEISPAVKSSFREIYPHRRGKTSALHTRDAFQDVTPGDEGRMKWSLTGQLNYSDSDLGESQAEKPYIDGYMDSRPPHRDPLRESQTSHTSRSRQGGSRSYAEEIENLKSHLSRSYLSEDNGPRQRPRSTDPHSLALHHHSGLNNSYHGNSGYDWEMRTPQGRSLSEFTPQRPFKAAGRSPVRSSGPVRGILKPASSDQDLRRIGRSSPPSRRSASPNVTFNMEVASRAISPQSTISRHETVGHLRGHSHSGGVPLFGVPARRYGIVRNLNDEFEDEEPVRDSENHSIQGFRAKNWFENKNRDLRHRVC
ncbi:uncharacterized protein LOC135466826 isoform X2 [Liolophura sinensis]|uniref:uncharacterized protein LOC135466826 isoform X2 n=1 Tax=Liolophura sinensis TaxID=3198878 RepID=UPI003158BFB7